MEAFVARTVERFGRLDVMMCNAGFGIAGAIDDIAPDQMQKLMDINYTGTYHATRAALPLFRRQRSGHVIMVSSITLPAVRSAGCTFRLFSTFDTP